MGFCVDEAEISSGAEVEEEKGGPGRGALAVMLGFELVLAEFASESEAVVPDEYCVATKTGRGMATCELRLPASTLAT